MPIPAKTVIMSENTHNANGLGVRIPHKPPGGYTRSLMP